MDELEHMLESARKRSHCVQFTCHLRWKSLLCGRVSRNVLGSSVQGMDANYNVDKDADQRTFSFQRCFMLES